MIQDTIKLLLENAFLVLFVLAMVLGLIGFARRANKKQGQLWEPSVFWMLLLFVGIGGIY